MNAKELRRLFRKQTGCSYWRMIVPDKSYDVVQSDIMSTLIRTYREDHAEYKGEEWDCDDIARDFWNFAKRVIRDARNENGIVGRAIFPKHAEIIYVQEKYTKDGSHPVYYVDQRNWNIYMPNKRPKWIEL